MDANFPAVGDSQHEMLTFLSIRRFAASCWISRPSCVNTLSPSTSITPPSMSLTAAAASASVLRFDVILTSTIPSFAYVAIVGSVCPSMNGRSIVSVSDSPTPNTLTDFEYMHASLSAIR